MLEENSGVVYFAAFLSSMDSIYMLVQIYELLALGSNLPFLKS